MRPKKKINQMDIANALGISNVTVSNALAGRKGVSDDLIRKVRQTAAEMGYEAGKSSPGKDGADDCSDFVVIVTRNGGTDGVSGCLTEWLTKQLRAWRFRVRYCAVDEISGEEDAKKDSFENCLGILVPMPLATEELLFLRKKNERPVIGIGFFDPRVPIDYVVDDGFHGSQLMVQYLRGKGYERILYVKPDEDSSVTEVQKAMWEDRLSGYRSELYLETMNCGRTVEQASPFDAEEVQSILTVKEAQTYLESRQDTDRKHAAAEQPRTVFFCGDMKTACALQDCLAGRRTAVPDEPAIAGYLTGWEPDPRTEERQGIMAYENSEGRLLEQCCALLRGGCDGRKRLGEVHLVLGEITEKRI